MKIKYKLQDKFDFLIFLPLLVLMLLGLAAIYSSTLHNPASTNNFEKQFIWMTASLIFFFIIYFLPQQTFKVLAMPTYLISILLLILVILFGKTTYGAKSWLSFGPFGFQPSEFSKIGVILLLAYWLGKREIDINRIKNLIIALFISFIPVALIIMEPDMGTVIVFISITLAMIFWSGINLFVIFVALSPSVVIFASLFGTPAFILSLILVIFALVYFKRNLFISATVFVVNLASGFFFEYIFKILQPHQQQRIITFLNPSSSPLGAGYNALQARLAIGSGGLFGKGFLHGNQTQLRFIPEQWTDFIYSVIGEEFGFIGSLVVIILFFIIFMRLLKLSKNAKDPFSSLVVIGVLTLLFVHFAINIGMNVGIAPVIGIPLPFFSYGGSSLLADTAMLGIAMNIYKNRRMHT